MPSFLTIIKDTSPLLLFSANWLAGVSENDGSLDQYTQSSFTATQAQDSSVSFNFYGSFIGVYGAKRNNHGNYEVTLDGNVSPTLNGNSSPAEFNQTLFSQGLSLGFHNMTVTNKANSFLDIDYIAFETSVGRDDEPLIINSYQDSHPAFTYAPSSAWNTSPSNVGTFSGGSGHATSQGSATATLTFQVSDAVALYGSVGPNGTTHYAVQLDNGSPSTFSANKQFYRPNQILFYAGNLGGGQHTLQVQLGSSSQGEFAIDYANVFTAPSLGGSNRLSSGTLAAIGITTTLAILSTLLAAFLFWRQRHNLFRYDARARIMSTISMDAPKPQPFVLSPAMESSIAAQSVTARYGSETTSQKSYPITTVAPSPPSSVGSPVESSFSQYYAAPAPVSQVAMPAPTTSQENSTYPRDEKRGLVLNPPQNYAPRQSLGIGPSTTVSENPPPEYSYVRS
ncbi:hypothetical protein CVT26_000086 [Gymnopilus dilepis]|uniref:Transmembrane protein n=1 Tax=Gymnopilus dilepis TaxID=231916 RepID=A0A409VGQ0_9AGAR|nr:hypothetical protein CVT26_000086 [Gymnopilus dilepis]